MQGMPGAPSVQVGDRDDLAACLEDVAEPKSNYIADLSDATLESKSCAIYALCEGARFTKLLKKGINVPIGFKPKDGTSSYTFRFNAMTGTITLYDKKADTQFTPSGSAVTYVFSIEDSEKDANGLIEDRFILFYDPTVEFELCFKDNKLLISNNPYSGDIVIKDVNGDPISGSPFAACNTEIDFSALAAGMYVVTFDGDKKYIVNKE